MEFKFVEGVDPQSVRARELAISERKSQAAKNAHQRRKARLLRSHVQDADLDRAPYTVAQFDALDRPVTSRPPHLASFGTLRVEQYVPASNKDGTPSLTLARPRADSKPKATDSVRPKQTPAKRRAAAPTTSKTCSSTHEYCCPNSRSRPSYFFRAGVPDNKPWTLSYRQPKGQKCLAFDNLSDQRSFDFWMTSTLVMGSRYSFIYTDIWEKLLPRLAFSSKAVRHVLLAHALSHEQLLHGQTAQAAALGLKALDHYHSGIKAMSAGANQLELGAAALLAFSYEFLHNNPENAMMHLQGCSNMLATSTRKESEELKSLKDYLYLIVETQKLFAGTPGNAEESAVLARDPRCRREDMTMAYDSSRALFTNTAEARLVFANVIEDIVTRRPDQIPMTAVRRVLGQAFTTLLSWDMVAPPSANTGALLLLLNVATGLLPEELAGSLNYAAHSLHWKYALGTAEKYLYGDQAGLNTPAAAKLEDEDDFLATVKMIGTYLLKYVHDPECQSRASILLQHVADRRAVCGIKTRHSP